MTLEEMRDEVIAAVPDGGYDEEAIDAKINEAFTQAVGPLNLPDLKRVDVVSSISNQSFTNLAALAKGFNGRISKVMTAGIKVFSSLENLVTDMEESGETFGTAGVITRIALEGSVLWYDYIPAVPQLITLILFGNPPLLSNDDDEPLGAIPPHTHRNIGVHGAASMLWAEIENGIEGEKVNTAYHSQMFEKGKQELKEHIARNRTHNITSRWTE